MSSDQLRKDTLTSEGREERSLKRRKISHPARAPTRAEPKTTKRGAKKPSKTKTSRRIKPQPPRERRRPKTQSTTRQPGNTKPASTNPNSSTNSPMTATALSTTKALLDNLFARHKNQHRTQTWWTSLATLRRALSRAVALEYEERQLLHPAVSSASASAREVRLRFEREAQIRREKEVWHAWMREVLVPRAYVGFTGLVGDPQFANLGVALVGVLADVVAVIGLPNPNPIDDGTKDVALKGQEGAGQARTLTATSRTVTGASRGEIVERTYDSDDLGEVIERSRSSGPDRKGKKKGLCHDEKGNDSSIPPATKIVVEKSNADVDAPSREQRRHQEQEQEQDDREDVFMADEEQKIKRGAISESSIGKQDTTHIHAVNEGDDDGATTRERAGTSMKRPHQEAQKPAPKERTTVTPKAVKVKVKRPPDSQPQSQSREVTEPRPDKMDREEDTSKQPSKMDVNVKSTSKDKRSVKSKDKSKSSLGKEKGKAKPKAKGKGNAIDDLFAGFS